jgi:hypothetical protein
MVPPKFLLRLPQRSDSGLFGLRAAVLRFSGTAKALGCAADKEWRVAVSCGVAGESAR